MKYKVIVSVRIEEVDDEESGFATLEAAEESYERIVTELQSDVLSSCRLE